MEIIKDKDVLTAIQNSKKRYQALIFDKNKHN